MKRKQEEMKQGDTRQKKRGGKGIKEVRRRERRW